MKKVTKEIIEWIRGYFYSTSGVNAVIGISGGKDSTVVAKLCCEALGKDHVIGIMMPNGVQKDLNDSKEICQYLGIRNMIIDISTAYNDLARCIYNADNDMPELSEQTKINLAPRLRMTTLYGVAQTLNGRVSCNGNLDEALMGYTTLWGDNCGDFAPIKWLHVSEVIAIGDDLGIPEKFTHKAPADGLTGMTDEQKLGFTYADVERMFDKYCNGVGADVSQYTAVEKRAFDQMKKSGWKRTMVDGIPCFMKNLKEKV